MQEHKRQKFLKRELLWVRKAPRARRTKSVDRVERYFEMAAQEAPEAEFDVELIIPTPPKLANRIIELRDVSVELGSRTLFEHVNLNLVAGERLGVVGRNGLGKSSLLKVILQELPVASGEVKRGGNVLMLDEPTNDLDLGTLRLLEEALVAFGGCVIVVSHDRYFLNRVCTSIFAFEGEGHVVYNVGDYDYYLERRVMLGPAPDSSPAPAGVAAAQKKSKEKPRKLKWKEEREWVSMEATILSAENEVSDLEATFAAPDFYAKPRAEIFDLETRLKTARDKVA